jgi:photosystem II stability/assembly factor-like uncharacterized protein
VLLATGDGGQTWKKLVLPCLTTADGGQFAAQNNVDMWMWCEDEPTMTQQSGQLYRSVDGGTRSGTQAGWVYSSSCLYRTTDAGSHWRLMRVNAGNGPVCTAPSGLS